MRRRGAPRTTCIPVALLCAALLLAATAGTARAECSTAGLPEGRLVAELQTSLGEICIELLDGEDEAPGHVENFLWYVDNGGIADTFFHRLVDGFVLQGAEYQIIGEDFAVVPARPDHVVENEPCDREGGPACPERGNEAYTVALAKLADKPDSGTTSWFINLADNRTNLDSQNGGFTVFGRIDDAPSRAVVDAIAALDLVDDPNDPADDVLTYSHLFWIDEDAIRLFGSPIPATSPYPPFAPGDYGCSDMSDQATLLQPDLSNLLFELYEPAGTSPIYETVSAACGSPFYGSVVTWVPAAGPASCPDLDRIALRSIEPTRFTGLFPTVPRPFEYVTFTCEQLDDATAQRDAFKQDQRDHFFAELAPDLVYIESVTIRTAPSPAPEPSTSSIAASALAAFAWLRHRARRRRAGP